MASRNMRRRKKSNKGLFIALLVLVMVLMMLLCGVLYYVWVYQPAQREKTRGGQREAEALQGSINLMTEEEIQQALNNIVEEGMFRISIASNIIAVQGEKAQVRIENNYSNRYVMQVKIHLDDTGEVIYSTDLIDPGYYIQEAYLDKELEPGTYAATAVFTARYPDNEDVVGTVGANVKIHVFPAGTTPTPVPTVTPTAEPAATPAP